MGYRPDDLVPLMSRPLPARGSAEVRYRQGIVVAWNQITAENTIAVGGAVMSNLAVLNTSEALLLAPGAVVALILIDGSWAILGRLTIPGTTDAATALSAVSNNIYSATVDTLESTSNTSYGALATAGPSVDVVIRPTGKAIVMVSAEINVGCPLAAAPKGRSGYMSYAITGPTNRSASDNKSLKLDNQTPDNANNHIDFRATRLCLEEGLTAGNYTFTAQYRTASFGGVTVEFANRNITVIAF